MVDSAQTARLSFYTDGATRSAWVLLPLFESGKEFLVYGCPCLQKVSNLADEPVVVRVAALYPGKRRERQLFRFSLEAWGERSTFFGLPVNTRVTLSVFSESQQGENKLLTQQIFRIVDENTLKDRGIEVHDVYRWYQD